MQADIVIIGGGIVGSSIAYHLAKDGRGGEITVVERDLTYNLAATPRGTGGVRQLFSLPENVAMTQFSLPFYQTFDQTMAVDSTPASISFTRQGYLFISDNGGHKTMEQNFRQQEKLGVDAQILDAGGVSKLFPSISTNGIALAVYSSGDAWIDAYSALQGFKNKARALGVTYINEEVISALIDNKNIKHLGFSSGTSIRSDLFILAAGAWSGDVGKKLNIDIPIEPMSRESYFFRCNKNLEPLPLIKTETDLAFRPEGIGYTGGIPDWSVPGGWNWDLSATYFEETVWPALANRIPSMDTLKLERAWRGHYARSTLDYNAFIGRWTSEPNNLFVATGFSGHGIMHAPATGMAMAELILDGKYNTLNLERLGPSRILENRPYRENGII